MDTKILSGKEVAAFVYKNLEAKIGELKMENVIPGLAAVLVGDDPASKIYVRSKTRRFNKLGLLSETFLFPADIDEGSLIHEIQTLNENSNFHGILVQLPLPKHLNEKKVLHEVMPQKDVDGFHPENLGLLTAGYPRYVPCTPKGILEILKYYEILIEGKHVVIVGRSNIVGRPLSILLGLKRKFGNATVTVCHSRTPDIPDHTKLADIIIAAVGVPQMIDADMIKEGTTLIDVGINRVKDDSEKGYHLVGDVDFQSVLGKAGAVTPVPGGVGPMTIAMLVANTVEAAEYFVSGGLVTGN
ncbi:MAG: bifunctional 5,10-methylenetetrahydrofolate dehydrogenase/5,10-methenyltetrahydrofolate cyclohydrolase [Candidatus Marinimicrobia bacterium]|nr:bifunctional 5,10-methylenetetrahydrofolate dehydrogenase/5,10-methenyltetrahydrofolate cyclohydrolase [Candidatus Neomarinimicrobiota bacterium]